MSVLDSIPLAVWPKCPMPDCGYRVCLWAGTGLCYKCSVQAVGKEEMDRRYTDTHDGASFASEEVERDG